MEATRPSQIQAKRSGSPRDVPEVVKHRGRFLNRLLESGTCYKYMGCASGLAAAAVVHGGNGLVGPYCGGWQLNAMGLEESRPDTLWVKPEDPGNLAMVLNNFLGVLCQIRRFFFFITMLSFFFFPFFFLETRGFSCL